MNKRLWIYESHTFELRIKTWIWKRSSQQWTLLLEYSLLRRSLPYSRLYPQFKCMIFIYSHSFIIYYQSQRSMRSHKLEYSQLKRPMQHVNDLTSVSLALHMPIQPIGEQTACVSKQKCSVTTWADCVKVVMLFLCVHFSNPSKSVKSGSSSELFQQLFACSSLYREKCNYAWSFLSHA